MSTRFRSLSRATWPVWVAALLVALLLVVPQPAAAQATCTTVCYVDATGGSDSNGGTSPADAFLTIQKGIDTVEPNGEVRVLPGSYDETATNRFVLGTNGPHQFGLFIAKNGVTIQGVTDADADITDPNNVAADITTNATNNFGYSGIFVEGDDVTIAGLEIGANTPGENKTLEIIGDGFTLKDSLLTGDGIDGAVPYFGDWRYDAGTDTSYIQSYTITNNIFGPGSQISINSGAGFSGPRSGRQITDNEFTMNAGQNWASISFTGDSSTVPWFVYPVGGAVITGNEFTNNAVGGQHIRVRGMADDSDFDWESYWNDNTYNKAVVVGPNPPSEVRAWSYTSGAYVFNDVRVIGTDIQPEVNHGEPGDTVLVNEGTYPESPNINKSLQLIGEDGRDVTTIDLQSGPTYLGALTIDGAIVTVQGFTIEGFDAVGSGLASSNVYVTSNPDDVTLTDNRFLVGQIGAGSNGDDGFGILTSYNDTSDVGKLLVEDNLFAPVGAAGGRRAFYINPGVDEFIFRGNTITGNFTATALTQAKDGLVENNTLTGNGTSRGFATWGYPDVTVYGQTLFQGNTISDVVNGIVIYASENVTVTKNTFTGNDRAVYVAEDEAFDLSTIHINRNSIDGNEMGIENWYATEVDGTCNWWGAASGPSGAGPGTGDPVGPNVDFTPWLLTSNLDGVCALPPANVCPVDGSGSTYTDLLGMGMGNGKTHKNQVKLNLPNATNLVDLYGQMVAKNTGQAREARFIMPGKNNVVKVENVTAPAANDNGVFWYGADLYDEGKEPAWVKARWFLRTNGVKTHIPRAFVAYATYEHATNTYVNVWHTYTPAEGEVYWDTAQGWTPLKVISVTIPAPLGTTTFNVELAVVDNAKDNRPVWVTVAAGDESETQQPTKPSNGEELNLMTFTLEGVDAGTNTIVITMYSPSPLIDEVDGESAALVGMAANYQCAPINPIP